MQTKLHIKKGDLVYVNAGEYNGTKGKVLSVNKKTNRALVEGVNLVSKHTKPSGENKGGIVKQEAPIHISNLQPLDPKTGNPTRIGRRRDTNNKLVRYSVKSSEEIK